MTITGEFVFVEVPFDKGMSLLYTQHTRIGYSPPHDHFVPALDRIHEVVAELSDGKV